MKKYELVADKIKAYITKNKLHHGDKLPTITELMKEYQVGKSTILLRSRSVILRFTVLMAFT